MTAWPPPKGQPTPSIIAPFTVLAIVCSCLYFIYSFVVSALAEHRVLSRDCTRAEISGQGEAQAGPMAQPHTLVAAQYCPENVRAMRNDAPSALLGGYGKAEKTT